MPHKISDNKQRTPAVTLRRSPRFLQLVVADLEDPKTPQPEKEGRTWLPSSVPPLSLNGNVKVSPCRRSHRSKSKVYSQKLDDSCNARRSTRLNRRADECNEENPAPGSNRQLEKRVTRGSCCKDLDKNVEKANYGDLSGNTIHGCSSGELVTEERSNISKQFKGSRKNKAKASKRICDNNFDQCDTLACDDKTSKRVLSITEKEVLGEELSEKRVDKTTNGIAVTTAIVVHEGPINRKDINKTQKNIRVKRTRNQFENTAEIGQGWTKDQELALERAYLKAKPTPQFWKKVSRMVPGKSAQECFDKIHGGHLTPPQPHTRSRPRLSNPKNPSLSPSKLLNTSSPTTKKPRYRKQKSHILHRTARHMLQNQYKLEQDSEADLFSALEPIFTQSLNFHAMLATPDRNPDQVLNGCQERSSTSNKKNISRFSSLYKAPLVSPPVLKQVKNKVLHEKYIDQLHCREANRKAASAKVEKLNQRKMMKPESSVERKDAIKAAKNALVFGAKDAINEFQDQQARGLNNLFDDESGADEDDG